VANAQTWYYTVVAVGLSGEGAISNPVSATTYTAVQNWRLTYFGTIGNTGAAADNADPDGDGMTNAQELATGTDPTSSASVLKVTQLQASGNDLILSFPTVLGKTYSVESSDTLQNGSWVIVQDNIVGTGAAVQITDVGAAAEGKRFYRIELLP
jgi:hypothetical protein